jgi:type II secretory pathway component PulJ
MLNERATQAMKIIPPQSNDKVRPPWAASGHTLIEAMFATAILVMVVMALLSAHWIGMKQNQLVESKAGASDSSRRTLSKLPEDIRGSKLWFIGNMSGTTFNGINDGSAQQGTALQLFTNNNSSSSQYTLYYFDLTDVNNNNGKLVRTESIPWNPVVIASNLIDTLYFTAENYAGQTATNEGTSKAYKGVIHTTLKFKQFQYPLTSVGSNCLYDYYQMDFMATPHLPE